LYHLVQTESKEKIEKNFRPYLIKTSEEGKMLYASSGVIASTGGDTCALLGLG